MFSLLLTVQASVQCLPVASRFLAPGYRAEWEPHRLRLWHQRTLVAEFKNPTKLDASLRDLNADGLPEMLVVERLGEWRAITHILRLSPNFKELNRLETIFPPRFSYDSQGRLLAQTFDPAIGPRPYPPVTLRLQGAVFQLAPELMPHPVSPETVREWMALARRKNDDRQLGLRFVMGHALCAGRPDLALRALHWTPYSPSQRRAILRNFRAEVRRSRWASDLARELPES